MKKEYQFYEMMGYPVPYQREFFGYFDQEKALVGGEPMELSRAKSSDALVQTQEVLHRWNKIWRYIPYVEMVCLTGHHSFNMEDSAIGCWIITSPQRMWSTYIKVKICFFFLNIWLQRKDLLPLRIDALQEETSLSIQQIKEGEYDIIPVYQLAHLSVVYQKFESYAWSLFEENNRIKDFLPNFPHQFVIGCGIQKTLGKTKIADTLESLFANKLGAMVNIVSKYLVLVVFLAGKKISGTSVRILESLVWRDVRHKQKSMLTWKVLRKK